MNTFIRLQVPKAPQYGGQDYHKNLLLEMLRQEWHEITPSEQARRLAEDLPDAHGLRALDLFQLAAALVWCSANPKNRIFICEDVKLAAAAQAVGFTMVP